MTRLGISRRQLLIAAATTTVAGLALPMLLSELAREAALPIRQRRVARSLFQTEITGSGR
jgi:hypothetical protein